MVVLVVVVVVVVLVVVVVVVGVLRVCQYRDMSCPNVLVFV